MSQEPRAEQETLLLRLDEAKRKLASAKKRKMWSCTQADLAGLVRDRHLVEKAVEELEKRIKGLEDEVRGFRDLCLMESWRQCRTVKAC